MNKLDIVKGDLLDQDVETIVNAWDRNIIPWWRSSEKSIRDSCRNALALADKARFESIAFPLIGAGTGGGSAGDVLSMMREELATIHYNGRIVIVKYAPGS